MRVVTAVRAFGQSALLLSLLTLSVPASADPAILLSRTICENQAETFGYLWKVANLANSKLFFLSGTNANNGNIHAVGHVDNFDASNEVYIFIHGNTDDVAGFSGQDFAAVFLANHPATPNTVNMTTCGSGTVPQGQGAVSSMAALARSYPGLQANSSLINAMEAPGPGTCPAQRSSANLPIVPIVTLDQAEMRTGVQHDVGFVAQATALTDDWNGNGVDYPGQPGVSFADRCTAQLALDPTGQWLPQFIGDVDTQFGAAYLALINKNYGGNLYVTCGAGNGVQCN